MYLILFLNSIFLYILMNIIPNFLILHGKLNSISFLFFHSFLSFFFGGYGRRSRLFAFLYILHILSPVFDLFLNPYPLFTKLLMPHKLNGLGEKVNEASHLRNRIPATASNCLEIFFFSLWKIP